MLALLQRLAPTDRIGLIGFDQSANVYADLIEVTPQARQHLQSLVQGMQVGSATNIGAGLQRAGDLLTQQPSERVKKMILLSDGETNTGITDPQALARMASDISDRHVVLSTIGMGLGFNEALMAALADHGMGHYAYLEHLDTLADILAQALEEARSLYAERSELDVQLRAGVQLVDAAGYPIEPIDQMSKPLPYQNWAIALGRSQDTHAHPHRPDHRKWRFRVGRYRLAYSHWRYGEKVVGA